MIFDDTSIPGVVRLRGPGLEQRLGQTSHSRSRRIGTLRGMHLQAEPHEEVNLRCLAGRIYAVVADLRPWSPTYLRWEAHVLGAGDGALQVPRGIAHGFQTLTAGAEVLYEISEPEPRAPSLGVRYDDPALGIAWPLRPVNVSDQDLAFPLLGPRSEAFTS